MKKWLFCIIAVMFASVPCVAGETDSAICGGSRIYVGDSKHKVRDLCGDPDSIDSAGSVKVTNQLRTKYNISGTETEVPVQEWRYKKKGYVFTITGNSVSAFTEI